MVVPGAQTKERHLEWDQGRHSYCPANKSGVASLVTHFSSRPNDVVATEFIDVGGIKFIWMRVLHRLDLLYEL